MVVESKEPWAQGFQGIEENFPPWHSGEAVWQLVVLLVFSQRQSDVILLFSQIRQSGELKHDDASAMK